MKVIAVVVTFNRLHLLKESIAGIMSQTTKVEELVVINNSSTDGTGAWLEGQQITTITQENNGGAPGFFTGLKTAFEKGADWVWIMDDDTIPYPTALQELMKCAEKPTLKQFGFFSSKAIWTDGTPHIMNLPDINTFVNGLPFSMYDNDGVSLVKYASFVSCLFSRNAILKAGLPIKEFYIWGDDQEYTSRITASGFLGGYVKDSVVLHKTPTNHSANIYIADKKDAWKHVYDVRNKLFIRKMRKGHFKFWTAVLKNYIIAPFSILAKRKTDKMFFVKVLWKGTNKAIGFNPSIKFVV